MQKEVKEICPCLVEEYQFPSRWGSTFMKVLLPKRLFSFIKIAEKRLSPFIEGVPILLCPRYFYPKTHSHFRRLKCEAENWSVYIEVLVIY